MSDERSISRDDELWLFFAGLVAVVIVLMNVDSIWARVSAWLVERHALVTDDILIPLPGDVGLDLSRVAVLIALLLGGGLLTRYLFRQAQSSRSQRLAERRTR